MYTNRNKHRYISKRHPLCDVWFCLQCHCASAPFYRLMRHTLKSLVDDAVFFRAPLPSPFHSNPSSCALLRVRPWQFRFSSVPDLSFVVEMPHHQRATEIFLADAGQTRRSQIVLAAIKQNSAWQVTAARRTIETDDVMLAFQHS